MTWPAAARVKVVTATVVGALAAGYVTGAWPAVSEWLTALWHLLAESTLVPNWLLGIFALCAIIVAGWLGAALRPVRQSRQPSQIHAQDNFFNIKWRWSYDAAGGVQELTPYCRHCDHRLVLKNVGGQRTPERYECRCDQCGSLACELDCSVEDFEGRVLARIGQAG